MNQIIRNLPKQKTQIFEEHKTGKLLGQIGMLHVRLAESKAEIKKAQSIRYDVFYREFGAHASPSCSASGLDQDLFDDHCDHLIVLDTEIVGSSEEQIVGTYRLMRKEHAQSAGGYYSAGEFAIASLMTRHKDRNFLELGRSCVLPKYRSKRTIELLWQGIWAYSQQYKIDVMLGCASFFGTVPARHAEALSFLHHHARTDVSWHIAPVPGRHVSMDLMPEEAINMKTALNTLPPLIKGYLRLGAKFGEGAVIDHEFNTIDVMVVLPVENISGRYKAYYGENAERFAA
ncbi:GNAT family N-acetyltransferase [Ahrensia sp. 13_GOM-1096m]|uniref:GNAT family N-acetyltransferase n=1 Tax=Ahrensia sp. 13_GOM-1096m TaxID=1380380 RepID=UPI00047CDE57|nr:GNAT family N-acetyltransferase [Ahrensia sp. 13_GOM-1096m]